ncbi:hypothetical protein C1645_876360 [Glomus cerebriforme]|uniref:Hsp70 family protein n=1 Tax=Glomus cerebriforme TaxID=658196 RepID=A0A397SV33_9GLOM|nr:hypothetical protein C1645_876360 [Glomus cerebriforme]
MANESNGPSENLFPDKLYEVIGKHTIDFTVNLLEENQNLKQQYEKLQKENQETLRINSDLKEKLLERDKQIEKLQQQNLETQKANGLKILKEAPSKRSLNSLNKFLGKDIGKSGIYSNIQVVVGLDFGTTYSGYTYWKENMYPWCGMRTNTILQYKDNHIDVSYWGQKVFNPLWIFDKQNKPIELFKLHLGNSPDNLKPKLPIDYKKVISDYLKEIAKDIKKHCSDGISYFENVLLILTIPEDYSDKDKDIIRECAHNAKLIKSKSSQKLQFVTEPEAAAIYCIKLQECDSLTIGSTFMIVDCGGYTVDLTTRKLVGNEPLQFGEVTECIRDFCGSTTIDKEFIKFLREKLGTRAIDLSIENHYYEFQQLVKEFRLRIKEPFTGDNTEISYELDIEEKGSNIMQYVNEETREIMKEKNWMIEFKYDDMKKMFDIVVNRIIRLIHIQLSNNQETCSAIFLVGGFSENKYFQKRIMQEFHDKVQTISVPDKPIDAIARGGLIYGLSINSDLNKLENNANVICSRILKYTYGIQLSSDWKEGIDPPDRKNSDGKICKFSPLARKGTEVVLDQTFSFNFKPELHQTHAKFEVYYTYEDSTKYINEPGMILLGVINIDLPDAHLDNRSIDFGLIFGEMKITALARNQLNGQQHLTTFCYPADECF